MNLVLLTAALLGCMGLFFLAHFSTIALGAIIIFLVTNCFAAYFISIIEMQNPKNIVWIRLTAPPDWLTDESDGFFAKYREKNAPAAAPAAA